MLKRYVARELFPLIRGITDQPDLGEGRPPPTKLLLDIKRRIASRSPSRGASPQWQSIRLHATMAWHVTMRSGEERRWTVVPIRDLCGAAASQLMS
jgi:hypothetical protein